MNSNKDGSRLVIGILRGFDRQVVEQLVPACERGGLGHLEITMNTPDAAELIRLACSLAGPAMRVGAGTVLTEQQLETALDSGAAFIVTPTVNEPVIRRCVEMRMPVFPGACTPTEILRAWDLGAAMVKLFPADQLGPAYVRSVKAPLPQVKLLPTGGVTLESVPQYLAAGADGFGVGSPLFDRKRIEAGDWQWVTERCQAFVKAMNVENHE